MRESERMSKINKTKREDKGREGERKPLSHGKVF